MFDDVYYEAVFEYLLKIRYLTELRIKPAIPTAESEDDFNAVTMEICVLEGQ